MLRVFVVWLGTVQMEDIKNLLSLPGMVDDAWASVTVIHVNFKQIKGGGGQTCHFLPGLDPSQAAMHVQQQWSKRYGHYC